MNELKKRNQLNHSLFNKVAVHRSFIKFDE